MVKQTVPSKSTLASTARSVEQPDKQPQSVFTSAAIGMGWQLAIVVLLPIVGGYKLDQKLGLTPWLTLLGLVLALVGSILVIRRALELMNNFDVTEHKS